MQGERVGYAAGDIRNWLTMGNTGNLRECEHGRVENSRTRGRGQGQGQGRSGREPGQVGDGATK